MKKHALGLLLFCFTLFVGSGIDWVYQKYPFFRCIGGGIGKADPSYQLLGGGFQRYRSFDGIELEYATAIFSSKESAERFFNILLKKSKSIIEREKIYDKDGKEIGERFIEQDISNGFSKEEIAGIVVRFNNKIVLISSTSLRYAISFEKKEKCFFN